YREACDELYLSPSQTSSHVIRGFRVTPRDPSWTTRGPHTQWQPTFQTTPNWGKKEGDASPPLAHNFTRRPSRLRLGLRLQHQVHVILRSLKPALSPRDTAVVVHVHPRHQLRRKRRELAHELCGFVRGGGGLDPLRNRQH